jgi:hypothetical protein
VSEIGVKIREVSEQMLQLQEALKRATVVFRDFGQQWGEAVEAELKRRREVRERQR